MVDSFLIESYGGALFKTFTRKDSYSENSQDKKICRESSIWATQPKSLWFLLIRFSLFSLYPSCQWRTWGDGERGDGAWGADAPPPNFKCPFFEC